MKKVGGNLVKKRTLADYEATLSNSSFSHSSRSHIHSSNDNYSDFQDHFY